MKWTQLIGPNGPGQIASKAGFDPAALHFGGIVGDLYSVLVLVQPVHVRRHRAALSHPPHNHPTPCSLADSSSAIS